ncbi:MAG: hypothetical protein F2681_10570 [Actinobacteria bacterium]|uniref:Unannotated protein n=1 Tax=freshwater metagenome TaxID=449393 RepID=A0A6J7JKU5_9ZZZZ|nr:hypothetical protein [Actinomycetota bacterium]MSW78326.1 hypothetical protein [Actinomycetota bacterium]MSX56348.1 hypothetical protein [Actinomycetota bacterium]MSX93951.1 hypothetical protein [Actinomycetota bacterium]MSZ83572.1 hypothetical protein [Actinomycetota bacterium]
MEPTRRPSLRRDRGAVDVSIQMLFGFMAVLFVMLLVFESVAYWHARNVYDEAAVEGVRVAAAYDGDCAHGVAAARDMIRRHAAGWGTQAVVTCTSGTTMSVTVDGYTPGVLGEQFGVRVRVVESAPKEQ